MKSLWPLNCKITFWGEQFWVMKPNGLFRQVTPLSLASRVSEKSVS